MKKNRIDLDSAEAMALQALTFLASDGQRLGRFLSLTGIGPDELRATAEAPHLQAAVLEHMLADESLLLVFTTESGIEPDQVGPAHAVLAKAHHDGQP